MIVRLGSNDFFAVPFPLVLADRFFHMYVDGDRRMKLDVFRWDETQQAPFYEVEGSKPAQENIEVNPTGIITFGEADRGFLFKFRPKPGVSQIFGKVPVNEEMLVQINDHSLRVMRGDNPVVTIERSECSGFAIGVLVQADGFMSFGSNALPAGMQLQRSA